jgi:hypothetical protein
MLSPEIQEAIRYAVFKCATNCFVKGQHGVNTIDSIKKEYESCIDEIENTLKEQANVG